MRKYLAQRLLIAVPTIFGVTVLIFIAMRVLPGDPLSAISGEGAGMYVLSQEQLRAARASLGLDRPYVVQYLDWLRDILRGDLGKSFWRGEPISELILRRAPITGQIALMAVILSAQATDRSVNDATRTLFPRANTPAANEPGGGSIERYHERLSKHDGRTAGFVPLSMLVQVLP